MGMEPLGQIFLVNLSKSMLDLMEVLGVLPVIKTFTITMDKAGIKFQVKLLILVLVPMVLYGV